jgi:O-antigen ligase
MTYQVWGVLAALTLIGLLPWVYRAPIRGIYLIVLALPLIVSPELPLLEHRLALVDIFIVVTGLAWVARWIFIPSTRRSLRLDPKLYVPLGIYYLVALISFANTLSTLWSSLELLSMIYLGALFFLFTQIVQSERELRRILQLWMISATIVVLFGLVQLVSVYTGLWRDQLLWFRPTIITSTFNFSNQLPSYLVTITPLFFFYITRGKAFLTRVAALIFVGTSFFVMLTTASRTTVGLIIAMILLYWLWHLIERRRQQGRFPVANLVSGGAIIAIILALIFAIRTDSFGIYSRLDKLPAIGRAVAIVRNLDLKQIDLERYMMYSVGFQAIREHPFIGVGIGSFRFYYERVPGGYPHEMHSNLLSLMAETGILGFLAFMTFIVVMLWYGKRISFNLDDDGWRHLGALLTIGFITNFFVYGAFLLGLRERHLWVGMALIVCLKMLNDHGLLKTSAPLLQDRAG